MIHEKNIFRIGSKFDTLVYMMPTKLIIEKGDDGKLWGRIKKGDNLLVDSATTVVELEKKMQSLLKKFHGIKEAQFKRQQS